MPIYTILLAVGNPIVDFFSLDVEGAEIEILKTIPWEKVHINVRTLYFNLHHILNLTTIRAMRGYFIDKVGTFSR